jgi:predicted metalloprotease
MQYDDLPESSNVEDRRGEGGGRGGGGLGGGGFGMPFGAGGMSIGTVVVLGLVGWALGIDPSFLIGGGQILTGGQPQVQTQQQPPGRKGVPKDESGRFVSRVLGSTEVVWRDLLAKDRMSYRAPVLVLFTNQTRAQCGGVAQSAMGPFYCPSDQRVYLDTSFFSMIETRFHGCDAGSKSCRFAQAYVIAHEVGHHVQNLFGILTKAHSAQQAAGDKPAANHIQVQVELQADCFAGIWANHSEEKWHLLQPGDVEAALRTAAAIGDDTLQKRSQGRVVPDSFTHGTSEQRQRWFNAGLKGGAVASCNTFAAAQL